MPFVSLLNITNTQTKIEDCPGSSTVNLFRQPLYKNVGSNGSIGGPSLPDVHPSSASARPRHFAVVQGGPSVKSEMLHHRSINQKCRTSQSIVISRYDQVLSSIGLMLNCCPSRTQGRPPPSSTSRLHHSESSLARGSRLEKFRRLEKMASNQTS